MAIEIFKICVATFLSSVASYLTIKMLDKLILDTSRTINVFFLLVIAIFIYGLLYLFLSWVLDIKELYLITKLITKAKEYQKRFLEIYSEYE